MLKTGLRRWGVAASLAVAVAGVAVAAPAIALEESTALAAATDQTYEFVDPNYELPLIASCPKCNGLSHELNWSDGNDGGNFFYSTSGTSAGFFFGSDDVKIVEAVSSNKDVISVWVGEYGGVSTAYIMAQKVGTATITLTADDGRTVSYTATGVDVSENPIAMEHAPHFITLTDLVFPMLEDGHTFDLANLKQPGDPDYDLWGECVGTGVGEGGLRYEIISRTSSDPSVLEWNAADYMLVPHKVGTVTLTATATDLAHPGVSVSGSVTVHVIDSSKEEQSPSVPGGEESGSASESVSIPTQSGATVTVKTPDAATAEKLEGVSFVSEHQGGAEMNRAWNALLTEVNGVQSGGYVYDLHLEAADGSVVAVPNGSSVKVTMPIPAGMGAEGLHVFHVAADGTVTDMGAVVDPEARTVTFTTTHFSTFVFAQVKEDKDNEATSKPSATLPQTGDASMLMIAASALAGAGMLAAGVRKRR